MKKIILFLIIILAMSSNAHAENVTNFWKLSGNTLSPLKSTWSLSVAGGITFGASTMSGALNMATFDINNAGGIYADATEQRGWSFDTPNRIVGKISGGTYYEFMADKIQFNGGTSQITTAASNASFTIDPAGTGIIKLGDIALTSLSSLSTNGTLMYDAEVLNNLYTGGITMATNRGDVPFIDWSVTNASADGTAQSLPFLIDGQFIMSLYSESDGAGSIDNKEVRTVALRNYGQLTTSKLTLPNSTALPATCVVGEVFLDTDSDDCADTGGGDGALCICKTTDTWVLLNNI